MGWGLPEAPPKPKNLRLKNHTTMRTLARIFYFRPERVQFRGTKKIFCHMTRIERTNFFCILPIAFSYGNSGKKIQHKISLFFKGVYIINCAIE